MSDTTRTSGAAGDEVEAARHDGGRHLAEAAERTGADDMLSQAAQSDPEALANVLSEEGAALVQDSGAASDEEVASISRGIAPKSDAPSRANITGSGSGADNM